MGAIVHVSEVLFLGFLVFMLFFKTYFCYGGHYGSESVYMVTLGSGLVAYIKGVYGSRWYAGVAGVELFGFLHLAVCALSARMAYLTPVLYIL